MNYRIVGAHGRLEPRDVVLHASTRRARCLRRRLGRPRRYWVGSCQNGKERSPDAHRGSSRAATDSSDTLQRHDTVSRSQTVPVGYQLDG